MPLYRSLASPDRACRMALRMALATQRGGNVVRDACRRCTSGGSNTSSTAAGFPNKLPNNAVGESSAAGSAPSPPTAPEKLPKRKKKTKTRSAARWSARHLVRMARRSVFRHLDPLAPLRTDACHSAHLHRRLKIHCTAVFMHALPRYHPHHCRRHSPVLLVMLGSCQFLVYAIIQYCTDAVLFFRPVFCCISRSMPRLSWRQRANSRSGSIASEEAD